MPEPTTVNAELAAMRRIAAALEALDPAAQDRIVGWMYDRYHVTIEDEAAQLARPEAPDAGHA